MSECLAVSSTLNYCFSLLHCSEFGQGGANSPGSFLDVVMASGGSGCDKAVTE